MKCKNHKPIRCEEMAEHDIDNLGCGVIGTCCVCAGHRCKESMTQRLCENWRSAADSSQSVARMHAEKYGKANDFYLENMERCRTLRDCADHLEKAHEMAEAQAC